MSDDKFIKQIMSMSMRDLLRLIMDDAYYLTDSYYSHIGQAIRKRAEELLS